jgi:hypothetical protein
MAHPRTPVLCTSLAFAACSASPPPPLSAIEEPDRTLAEHALPSIAARLLSDDEAQIALATDEVLQNRRVDLVPEVRLALAKWRDRSDEVGVCGARRLLRVCARFDVDLPEDEVSPLLRGLLLDDAFALIARRPEDHLGSLLEVFRDRRVLVGADWIAAGDLLGEHHAPGFEAALLRHARRIRVYCAPDGAIDLECAESQSEICCGRDHHCRSFENPNPHLRRWLGAFVAVGPPWPTEQVLVATTADALRTQIAALRRERQAWFVATVAALHAGGRLTEAESAELAREQELVVEDFGCGQSTTQVALPGVRLVPAWSR